MSPADVLAAALADRYRIERELGQGGMATVYLAEDLRHHRKVALKVLRPELAATLGPERFLREVTIAAGLQHPNILPVHDSGEAAGFLYYVMPFVEGHSLRERLAREGELPVAEAARILRDVADALSAAHAKGVVHRDIKPENVLLTGRHAVVADFGVAKAVSEATGRQTLTTAGVALGTPTYMAPEQAAASPHVDHRADLYAFGVMAYEMLTGQPPFTAATPQGILAAHVTEAPVPVTQRRATIPPALAQLVMRCLAKKSADRWQSAEELLPQLEALATPSGGITPTETQPVLAAPAALGRRRLLVAAAAAVAVIAAGLLVARLLRPGPLGIIISDITAVTAEPGVEFQPAISPDGKEVAYVAGAIGAPHLVIRSVAGGGEARAADSSLRSEWLPSWSPEGDFVRFGACRASGCTWNETGKLGGAVRSVRMPPRALIQRTVAWSPDGARVAFAVRDTLFVSSVADTAAHLVAVHATDYWYLHSLAWSPDGTRIAYVNGNPAWQISGNVAGSSIWVVDAAGGAPREVVGAVYLNASPTWLDARHLLFVSNRDGPRGVYVVEIGHAGRRGEPRLVPGAGDPHSISYSIAAKTLAWAKFTLRQNIRAYPLGRPTSISISDGRPVTSGSQVIEEHDVSPDGRWLVFDSNRRGSMDLYRMPVGGGAAVALTADSGDEFGPRWSPDGREIAFYADVAPGLSDILIMPATGGTPVAAVNVRGPLTAMPRWSPNGREIAFQMEREPGHVGVEVVSRDSIGGPWHQARPLTNLCPYPADWAPDGAGVLCMSRAGSVLLLVSPDGRVLWRYDLAAANGLEGTGVSSSYACYSRDGHTIYLPATHRDGRQGIWAIPASGGPARLIVAADDSAVVLMGALSVGPDRLYVTVSEYESDIWVAKLRW
jgi:Tol biopolymer transport system component/tRNA A-37 threonylcarbamoyl transferase component Bud32